jgi:hypothetical protein
MAFIVSLGSISISINPAALLNPVVAHPGSAASTYATFTENVVKTGLAATVYEAFKGVIEINTHANARIKWPTAYGTTDEPYGTTGDPVTGVRPVAVVDEGDNIRRWTDTIRMVANSRKSFLDHYAEVAVAVAAGIKAAMESNIRTGRVTMPGFDGITQSTVTVSTPLASNSEVFVNAVGDGIIIRSAEVLTRTSGGFTIASDGGPAPYPVSWLVVG